MKRAKITWQGVVVLCTGMATFAAIAIFAEESTRTMLLGADGLVCTLVALYLRSPRDVALPSGGDQ
jgi:hypothetical protein